MNIWNNKITPSIIIFIIALILRIGFIKTYKVDYISNDGVTYHNIAVNIVLGRGYSNCPNPPYEPYFFREPVYPLFISTVYFIYHKLGGDLTYISSYSENRIYPNHKEFIYLKIIQAIIDSISCVLMYLIFSLVIKNKYIFIFSIVYSLYFPIAVQCVFYLREVIQMFLILLLNISLLKYIINKKFIYIIMISIIYALLILTFQIHILLFPFIILFLYLNNKNIVLTLKNTLMGFIIVICILSPWLYRTYKFYPDIKVFKNVGLSFTSEQMKWVSSLREAKKYKLITNDEFQQYVQSWFQTPDKLKFQYSFDGTYQKWCDSLQALTAPVAKKESFITKTKYSTRILLDRFKNSFFRKLSLSEKSISECIKSKNIMLFIPYLLGIIIGLLGLFSFIYNFKKLWIISMPFLFYTSIFYFIGDEARRMIVVHGYLFMFFMILITQLIEKHKSKTIFNI